MEMNQSVLDSKLFLFDPRQAVTWRTWNNKSLTSDKAFYGQNPPNGGIINFYLKDSLVDRENVSITIHDAKGTTIRTQNCTRLNPQAAQTPAIGLEPVAAGAGEVAALVSAEAAVAVVMPRRVSIVGSGTSEPVR